MTEEQIADVWTLFKGYVDKKQIDVVAEKFVDMLADYGVADETFKEVLGTDGELDSAIHYYLDLDADNEWYADEDDWDD